MPHLPCRRQKFTLLVEHFPATFMDIGPLRSGSQRSGASWLLMTSESPTAPPTVSSTDWEWRGVTGSQEVKTNRRRSNSRDSSSNDSSLKSCHHSLLKHVGSPQQSAKLNGKSGSNNSTTSKSNTNSKTAIRPSSCNNCHLRATLQIRPPGGGGIGTLVIPPSNPPPPPPPAQSSLPTSQQRQPQWGQMAEVASLQSELEATKMELEQTKARLDAFNAQAQAM
ncbi:hypothetical protein AAG570_010003 [Ranatra chinensis]|uniref:Uncharacterized protein n=1 Tax=Ranatra chinensis TaxID=642074 RepID=A0ABD0YQQ6_9HEMI